jgi:hypothetical protein
MTPFMVYIYVCTEERVEGLSIHCLWLQILYSESKFHYLYFHLHDL